MKAKIRGLEPVVAAVLLIVVAVIGAVLVYLWFAGFITKSTSQAEQMTASERLKIEAASLTTSPLQARLHIRNLGGDVVRLAHAYVFRPGSMSAICTGTITSPSPPTIDAGAVQSVTISLSCTTAINSGHDYVIKVVTQKGTEFAVTVTAS